MPEASQNGVDAAIGILCALAAANGSARGSVLARQLNIPRASFHRIARVLADAGLLTIERGLLRVGPSCAAFIAANAADLARQDARREQRARGRNGPQPVPVLSLEPEAPLVLSPPVQRRRSRRLRIGFSNTSMGNPWRVALVHSIEHAAANLGDEIEWLRVRHAGGSRKQQVADIQALVDEGVDGLLVSSTIPDAVAEAVAGAMARDVAVVLVERGVSAEVPHTSFVTADDAVIGRTTALWLAETLKGEGGVVLLSGRADAVPAQLRLAAAREVFARFPGIEILDTIWTDWERNRARRSVSEAIARWGDAIAGVWCDSGQQGVGSIEAFVEAGYGPGTIPPHTGGDINLCYKLAIRHQVRMVATDYPPAMGLRAVEALHASLAGNWVPRFIDVPSDVVLSRGAATRSVRSNLVLDDHVRWDLPDNLILGSGLGPSYNPRAFRIRYPGNVYNRSAAPQVLL
ncbi:substrate-binding domain-containing protein [Devosia sp. D6-9]|nr:substrate-binding domain-containing protein [Devosia sp. D6-9]